MRSARCAFWSAIGDFFTETIPAWANSVYNAAVNFFTVSVPTFFTNLWATVAAFVTEKIPEYAKELQDSITGWFGISRSGQAGHLPKALQEIPCRGLEELFSIPMNRAPLPGDIVCVPDKNKPLILDKYVVVRREFSPYGGSGIWNIRILVRPLTEEEEKQMNCEFFGIEKWPETKEEGRAFEEKLVPKAKSLD